MLRLILSVYTYLAFFTAGLLALPIFAVCALVHRADPGARLRGRLMRTFGRSVVKVTPFWRFSVSGEAPAGIRERPFVVIANHESTADPFLLAHLPWDMRWVAKAEIARVPIIGWLIALGGDIFLRRGERESVANMFAACRRTLEAGVPVMIFPEGTRSRDGAMLPFKDGAFKLAIETGVPVLPLAVAGTRECMAAGSPAFGYARARVRVLEPISTEGMTLDDLPRLRDQARGRIAAALPALRLEMGLSGPNADPQPPPRATRSNSDCSELEERPWHKNYPPGVTREADLLPFENLGAMARAAAARYAGQPACSIVLPNGWEAGLSYAEVDRLSERFAAFLGSRGIGKGERVAIMLPNCLGYPVCSLGVLKAGAVLVNTNPLYTGPEMLKQLRDSGARAVIIIENFAGKLETVLEQTEVQTVVSVSVADFFPALRGAAIRAKLRLSGAVKRSRLPSISLARALRVGEKHLKGEIAGCPEPRSGDVALLQYTGGTTGVSKGAMLTHGNLLANVAQILQITRGSLEVGRETVLTVLPLYHVFAFTINQLYSFHCGYHSVLVPNPKPLSSLEPAFRAHHITWTTAVNTLLKGLLAEDWFVRNTPKGIKGVYAGGMEVAPAVLERWEKLTGSLVIEGFGLSEASPLVTFNPTTRDGARMRRTIEQLNGVGLPLPGCDVRILDENGEPVAEGERGELAVRGPQVMRGYWNQPEETARVLVDGWLRTGDIATMDADGYVRITDRKKDMIVVSGFKVFPNEVEACIASHPLVADVAVLGVPDEATGEAVRAFVVPRGTALTAEEVIAHCRKALTGYKIPRAISFVGEMPKSPVGKVLRRELRSMIAPAAVMRHKNEAMLAS